MVTIGKLIEKERKNRNITQRKLAQGICSFQMIYKIEGDECNVDKFLFDILIERLGKCPDELEYIISKDEYEKIVQRKDIEAAIIHRKRDLAEKLLDAYYSQFENKNHIQEMYFHRTKAFILEECRNSKQDLEDALNHIILAIEQTLPTFSIEQIPNILFSTWEMENILEYAKILYMLGEVEQVEKAYSILEECYSAIKNENISVELKSKLLPKCIYLMTCYYNDSNKDALLVSRCEEAIELLRDYSVIYLMIPLLRNTIALYKKRGNEERVLYWEKFYKLLLSVNDGYSDNMILDSLIFHWKQCLYYLDYEVIRGERLNLHISQERLIDSIFSNPVSLSNIENGKSIASKVKFDALMERLEIRKTRYGSFVAVNSFKELEWAQELRHKVSKREYKKILEIIIEKEKEEISDELRRLINAYKCIAESYLNVDYNKDGRSVKELQLLSSLNEEKYQRVPFLWEIDFIFLYLDEEWNRGNKEYVVRTCRKLLEVAKSSDLDMQYCYRVYAYILGEYLLYEGRNALYDDDEELFNEGIVYSLHCGKGSMLSTLFWGKATSKKQAMCNNSQSFFRAYLFAELYKDMSAESKKYYYERSLL